MTIVRVELSVTTTGEDASAIGSGSSSVVIPAGILRGILATFHASAPATTDTTITIGGFTVLTLTDVNTTGLYIPQAVAQDVAGADVTYDGTNEIYRPIPVSGKLAVSVAGANALTDCVTVYAFVEV